MISIFVSTRAFWFGMLLSCFFSLTQADGSVPQPAQRAVAVTFDDLPFVAGNRNSSDVRELSARLLKQVTDNAMPAVGFVNEARLYVLGELDPQQVAILDSWLAAGLELGNHTYSHASLNRNPLADLMQDVIRGESVIKQLMQERGKPLRYFRHPFLHVGKTAETRSAFEKFLANRGYTVAPVTINHAEWVFAAAYDKACRQGNEAEMRRVSEAYIPYMEQVVIEAEKQSFNLFGYEIKHVLLLHANALNAVHLGDLAAMLKRRGYAFITLGEALQDRAYGSPNTYVGANGLSWLDQWSHSFGLRQQQDVKVPPFVRGLAGREANTGYQGQ